MMAAFEIVTSVIWFIAAVAAVLASVHHWRSFARDRQEVRARFEKLLESFERLRKGLEDGIGKQSDSGRKPWS